MKKKFLLTFPILISVVSLSACSNLWSFIKNGFTSNEESAQKSEEGNGYYRPSSMKYLANDFDKSYCPAQGKINILIIPIQFKSQSEITTNIDTSHIQYCYFGDYSLSLKNYYKTASFGKVDFDGIITSPFVTSLTASIVNNYGEDEFDLFLTNAYNTAIKNTNIDLSKFDKDGNGWADAVHFITNIKEEAFDYKLNQGYLWPHMWNINNNPGTKDKPTLNTYLCAPYGMLNDTTIIHEQGHVFGLEDYYNYSSNSYTDFIGGFDMQNLNCGDWNSFSKLLMGWTTPYVIDGTFDSVTLTINPASISGDCILIPSYESEWNGSAFSEYILIELFTNCGNNTLGWNDWIDIADLYGSTGATSLGKGGVRLYHVDSRVYGFDTFTQGREYINVTDGEYISGVASSEYKYVTVPQTNSKNNFDYVGINVPAAKNNHLLSLIQAGKVNTFKTGTTRNALAKSDLFKTGDKFTLESYVSFFNNGRMNNGDDFPYEIIFNSVSETEANITINKI